MEIVAIVGRPNVGKSSLFNRILGEKRSIVDETPGVTRDRIYARAEFKGKDFVLVDTGGFEPEKDERIKELVAKQMDAAISEADIVLVLFDGKTGLLPDDSKLVQKMRDAGKKAVFAINKIDGRDSEQNIYDFYALGLEKVHHISAIQGLGIEDLLIDICSNLTGPEIAPKSIKATRLSVIGRPNVGKSLLINKILRYERVAVDDKPGTTRDSIDTPFVYKDHDYVLVDTAGIRRRSRIDTKLEIVTVMAALKAIERSDIVVLVVDSTKEIAVQDLKISNYAVSRGKAIIMVVNKLDLIEESEKIDFVEFEKKLKKIYPSLSFCPFIFTSAIKGWNVEKIMDEANKVGRSYVRKLKTTDLNRFLKELNLNAKLGFVKGKKIRAKVRYMTQIGQSPPRFLVFCNNPVYLKDKFDRYLSNQIRQKFSFYGVPIMITYKKG